VRDKPAETEEEKEKLRLEKAEKKARKEERRMRRAEKAGRRARTGHKVMDRLRSLSRDRSSRSRSPMRMGKDRGREREYEPRRPRSWSRTPPRRGSYSEREWDRDRRR
jgi:hypothetical protein